MPTKVTTKRDQKTMNVSGHHKSADTNALYQEENNVMHKQRNKVLHFTEPNEDKCKKKKRRKSRCKSKKCKKKHRSTVVMVQPPVAASIPAPATISGSLM